VAFENERVQRRLTALGILIVFAFGILLTRLWFLQVLVGAEYVKIARENQIRSVTTDAPRGNIYDRHGNTLVRNRAGLTVSMSAASGDDSKATQEKRRIVIQRLSVILGMAVDEIEKRLASKHVDPYKPILIKEDIPEQVAAFIKEHQLDFPYVVIESRPVREYPNGNLAAHILGYLGEVSEDELKQDKYKNYRMGDEIGREGVENTYEAYLAGRKGEQRIEVNAAGYPVQTFQTRQTQAGDDLYLTIDKNLQIVAENLLSDALKQARKSYDAESKKNYQAPAGAIVIMNPNNGEILAMASAPTYDPRLFVGGISQEAWDVLNNPASHYPLNNRAMTNSYPPGSTMKAITASAALSEGLTSPDTVYFDRGVWTGAGEQWPQYCWFKSGHGWITLNEGIVQSCDTVFYEIGLQFYKIRNTRGEKLQEYASRFGLGSATGIDLPGEDGGRIPTKVWKERWNRKNHEYQIWYPGDSTNLAIGQGDLLTTPLQMAVAYSAIANGGTVYQPHVVKRMEWEGRIIKENRPTKMGELGIPPAVINTVRANLEKVVTRGTGLGAFAGFPFNRVSVAGKTGTSEIAGRQHTAWFVAYAPADKPQYVVAVMIEEGGYGVAAAAPVARKIIENLYGIRSDFGIRIESTVD
jgi:penicillin-binding protein 2